MRDKEFFTLIDRAYKRAGKTWDWVDPAIMRGALGYCDVGQEMAWVVDTLDSRTTNHVLLHELAHLVAEETDDYYYDELVVEQATRVVLSLKDYLSPLENIDFMGRIRWYKQCTKVRGEDEVERLIDELLKLFEEEYQ